MPDRDESSAHWSERMAERLTVEIEAGRRAVRVAFDGRSFLRVDETLASVLIGPPPWRDAAEEAEIRCGPGLITALALRGRFCLHASGIERGGEAVLFLGASGAGKSTLAREIAAQSDGWRRLTDDMTPIEPAADRLVLFPAFPQLKLAPSDRWPGPAGASLPVRAICVLAAGGQEAAVELEPFGERDAALALIAHTAATRLFDEELLALHLELAARAARLARFVRLVYPHRASSPAEVAVRLDRFLAREGG